MNVNIKNILQTQSQFVLDELNKKDLKKMPLNELETNIKRLYALQPPDEAHKIAIFTIHKRYEESLKPIQKKHKFDKIMQDMLKLQKKFDKYETEQQKLMRGYMMQEINGFKIEKKLK